MSLFCELDRYMISLYREAMSTVFGTIHFLEIILLLPVPETSRSFWINACQAGERIIFFSFSASFAAARHSFM